MSRTGLSVSPKKVQSITKRLRFDLNLSQCAVTKSVQYSLRPFAGLYNPYSSNCSILCNHPGPNEIKKVVKQVKEQFVDGKNPNPDEFIHVCSDDTSCELINVSQILNAEKVSEEFFRHYAGSDSRPLTPTPTIISNRTRISNGSFLFTSRRCHTPDPITTCANERKQLVLDLRRSHSQETLYCNPSSGMSYQPPDSSLATSKIDRSIMESPQPKNLRLCEQEARKRSAEILALQQLKDMEPIPNSVVCINDRNDIDDELDGIRRRGKKKRKTKEGNTFRMNQEPETQITTIEPFDSPSASARNQQTTNTNIKPTMLNDTKSNTNERSRDSHYLRSNFITEDALKILRRGLDIDVVESAFQKFVSIYYKSLHVDR